MFGILSKKQTHVLNLTEQALILCEQQSKNLWHLSYFFMGPYGNYLLGIPKKWKTFDKYFSARGGIAYVVPLNSSTNTAEDVQLFDRFGASWIVPSSDSSWDHVKVSCSAQLGIKIKKHAKTGEFYDLDFNFNDRNYHATGNPLATTLERDSKQIKAQMIVSTFNQHPRHLKSNALE